MGIQISAIGFAIVVMLAIAVVGPRRIFAQIPSFEEPFPEPVPDDGGIIFSQPFPPDGEVPFPLPLQFPIPDGTLLRELNSRDAYIIYGNAKFFIANPGIFSAVGFFMG